MGLTGQTQDFVVGDEALSFVYKHMLDLSTSFLNLTKLWPFHFQYNHSKWNACLKSFILKD